ncbi:hypothetical protein Q5692_39240, partial [Microcoleus sp. C2C3]|uniref:hypothetical protein n=1 Tax=Microcoleus sp. C2C6 TaxID=3055325 RepID=UPI002FCFB26D
MVEKREWGVGSGEERERGREGEGERGRGGERERGREHYSQVKLKALLSMSKITHLLPVDP